MYVRSAYRNDPDFQTSRLDTPNEPTDNVRVNRSIENDQAVAQNYQRLVYDTMAGVYNAANDAKTVLALRNELVGELRRSMRTVFGDLVLNNISNPISAGTFYFEKGSSKNYQYKNLSGGEKAAFDLLLDLHIKKRFFRDTIYAIDEIETHLHTAVQGKLLREMVNVLPDPCQLWVTTHSIGVLRAAQELSVSSPGSVCVIDFDGIEQDTPCEVYPSNLGRVAWQKMLSVTLDDLSPRMAPKTIVICEGSSTGTRRKDFDAEIYNRILGSRHPDLVFVSGGASNQVSATGSTIGDALRAILPQTRTIALADLDNKTPREVADFEVGGNIVLKRRNLESYLLDDEVIIALVQREGRDGQADDALRIKADALLAAVGRGNPPDDLKSAAGDIQVGLTRLLGLRQRGNNKDAFMRDTLAPLVTEDMAVYRALKAEVTDRIP